MTESSAGVAPQPPNWGPSTSGSAMSMAAFGSPVTPQAGTPAFSTSVGLAPNQAGSHSTMSASLPTSTEPTSWASPCATAGLRVSLARYRSTRSLSSGPENPTARFITEAQPQPTSSSVMPGFKASLPSARSIFAICASSSVMSSRS